MLWSLCWRRCLRCASDALSASPFPCCRRLFRSRWILVGVLQRSFDGKSSPARIPCNVLRLLFCVICTEVARDSPIVNFPGNTKCSMTSLAENQAIYSKKERKKERKMGHPILQLPKTTRGSRAGIINSLRSRPSAARFVRIKHTLAERNDSESCWRYSMNFKAKNCSFFVWNISLKMQTGFLSIQLRSYGYSVSTRSKSLSTNVVMNNPGNRGDRT